MIKLTFDKPNFLSDLSLAWPREFHMHVYITNQVTKEEDKRKDEEDEDEKKGMRGIAGEIGGSSYF